MRMILLFLSVDICIVVACGFTFASVGWSRLVACVALIVALILMIWLYRMVVNPMRTLANGINLLRERDFNSRLAITGYREADNIVSLFNDMMRVLREERIKIIEQNHLLDLLMKVSPMGIIMLGDDGDSIVNINRAAVTFLELDIDVGEISTGLSKCDSELGRVLNTLSQDEVKTVRLGDSMVYKCSRLSFMDKGYSHPFILIERLTDEVIKAEKDTYGKVIRVMAHEVNNTASGIQSMLQIVKEVIDADHRDSEMSEVLDTCRKRSEDMCEFIHRLAEVVKIPDPNPHTTNMMDFLASESLILESMCRTRGIDFSMEVYDCSDKSVKMDTVLMSQVLANIVKNSVESIGEKHSGKVILTLSVCKDCPVLTVTDNGAGISDKDVGKLFTPFYTTKPNGNGIGLMYVREVLVKHGFGFSLRTDATDGLTRFTIKLHKE